MIGVSMKPLVIVDMQSGFGTSHNPHTIAGVIHEIKLTKRRKSPVFLLEWEDYGSTHQPIIKALEGIYYKTLIKQSNSGAHHLFQEWENGEYVWKRQPDKVVVCGVNASFCVYDTATDLASKGVKVEIVENACNDIRGLDFEHIKSRLLLDGYTNVTFTKRVQEPCITMLPS